MALDLGIFLEGAQSSFKVKVSSNDTQPDYLINKFISSDASVTITETNDGGVETIDLVAVPAAGDNFSTADLTFSANRTHDLAGYVLTIEGIDNNDFAISDASSVKISDFGRSSFLQGWYNTSGTQRLKIGTGGDIVYTAAGAGAGNDGVITMKNTSSNEVTRLGLRSSAGHFSLNNSSGTGIFWFNANSGESTYINRNVFIGGTTSATAQLQVKGSGSTSGTTTLIVENSSGTDILKINDGSQIGFFNTTPASQQSGTGETTGFTAGAGTGVNDDSTFTGNVGATAYRINDIVKALKNYGLLAS